MNILIIGSGGREHALAWKVSQSKHVKQIFIAPGNPGTAAIGTNVAIAVDDLSHLLVFALDKKIDLTIVGPEVPLSLGIVNLFQANKLAIFGPTKLAAQIETDKVWTTNFMEEYHIPHPESAVFTSSEKAVRFLEKNKKKQWVMKASGLAAGKGVILPETLEDAKQTVVDILDKKIFGSAGDILLLQERIAGPEISITALVDGKSFLIFPPSQDHKRVLAGNLGPNTGGMGAYAPVPFVSKKIIGQIKKTILEPFVRGMIEEGHPYQGVIYPGLMLTEKGPMVLEFNARFGDPETEPLMLLLKNDIVDLFASCINQTLNKQKLEIYKGSAATVILTAKGYPDTPEKGVVINGLAKKRNKKVMVFHAGTKETNGTIVTNGGRVLAISSHARTLEKALQNIYNSIGSKKSQISFAGMHYRKDIGYQALPSLEKKDSVNLSASHRQLTTSQVHRIAVMQEHDTRAIVKQKILEQQGYKGKINTLKLVDVYTVDKQLSDEEVQTVANLLTNPVTQSYVLNSYNSPETFTPVTEKFDYVLEIGLHPGVTDNIATTTQETIQDALRTPFVADEHVYTSQLMYLTGKLSLDDVKNIGESLANPLIQSIRIKDYETYIADHGMLTPLPKVHLTEKGSVDVVNLNVGDAELISIGKQGIMGKDGKRRGPLALDLLAMKAIQAHFRILRRSPTDIELESIAQTWSEHCKHTIFASPIDDKKDGIFTSYIKAATDVIRNKKGQGDICVSVFSDNSGAIAFDDTYLITHKVETHNSPSALDPFGGAITGIVGVNRDAIGFGLGAKPIANTYGFCFAQPDIKRVLYKDKNLTQQMLLPKRILEGVVSGVNVGGNCSGIPTPQGFVYFDKRYQGKPLVFVGTVGLLPRTEHEKDLTKKKANPGDYIVMVGGRVGKDGIHGATFSSEAIDAGSPMTAVQIGDPITQKKLSDVLVKEIRHLNLYTSITDNGAGGLSCSVSEMAKESGGCEVILEKVPLKYPGLQPWETWISESQERMTLAVPVEKWKEFNHLMKNRGVEATIIGTFTDSGRCKVVLHNKTIMDISLHFLHDGVPLRHLRTAKLLTVTSDEQFPQVKDQNKLLQSMLARPSIASFAFISAQYDHEVQSTSVLKPLQGKGRVNGDASVLQPRLDLQKGVVLSQALYPNASEIDAYHMAAASIDTAIRNCIAVGGDLEKIALLDNFCWTDSYNPERLAQLKLAAQACYDYAVSFGTPFISGKDSMFNDFRGYDEKGNPVMISIPPTLLISTIGVIDDVTKVVSQDVKESGDLLYILGDTYEELGGSEYLCLLSDEYKKEFASISVPRVDAKKNKRLYRAFTQAVTKELIASSISIHHGGLLVALAKMSMAGQLGVSVDLKNLPGVVHHDMFAFYSESQGRLLVSVSPLLQKEFEELFADVSFALIGNVRSDSLFRVKGLDGRLAIDTDVEILLEMYRETFEGY